MFGYLLLWLMCTLIDQALSNERVVSMRITDYNYKSCSEIECTPCLNVHVSWDNSLTCQHPHRKTCDCCNNCGPDICSCPDKQKSFDLNTDSKLIQRQIPKNQISAIVLVYACPYSEYISPAVGTDAFLLFCTAINDLSTPSQNLLMQSRNIHHGTQRGTKALLRFQWNITTSEKILSSSKPKIEDQKPITEDQKPITEDPLLERTSSGFSAGLIAGIVIGGLLGVAILSTICIIFFMFCYDRKTTRVDINSNPRHSM